VTRSLLIEDVNLIIGAMDTLAVALADHGHCWSDGERSIYEQALGALGVPLSEAETDES